MTALEVEPDGKFVDPPEKRVIESGLKKEMENMNSAALAYLAAGIGAGLAIIGAGGGIGKLAASAMDGIARQPSAGGDIRGAMILAAALIEGATFFALIICILLAFKS